jgi:hypothetical protein
MKRAAAWTWAGAFLILLALFATPLHLSVEAHEWHHEDAEDHHHDSEQEQGTHPAVDHELAALAKAPRLVLPLVEIVYIHLSILPPDVRAWVPSIEPEAQSPPDVFASPPRSPRSPPV